VARVREHMDQGKLSTLGWVIRHPGQARSVVHWLRRLPRTTIAPSADPAGDVLRRRFGGIGLLGTGRHAQAALVLPPTAEQYWRGPKRKVFRNKMAAARRKGKWVGGCPVLGYDVDPGGGRLVVNEEEAERVRAIFALFEEHGSALRTLAEIERRIVALPMPAANYIGLATGKQGSLYFLKIPESDRFGEHPVTLYRWVWADRKTEKLAERVLSFELSANGDKMLLSLSKHDPDAADAGADKGGPPEWVIVPADAPVKPGEGKISFADLKVRVDPPAEWAQMYHEVWRIERSYFYDPHYHGTDTVAAERRYEPYVASVASRADLNYIFHEMLGAFSVGHLRGSGGAIPKAQHVPGGLLGADYVLHNNRYCLAKIYTGGEFNPEEKAPLAQPGLNLSVGDCIVAINGQELTASTDIQEPLEGTADHVISLHIQSADGKNGRDISVTPIASEAMLRNIDWIESNQRKVDQLSGGKLAYVYLPNTAEAGFTNFNRYYFAQTDKQGAIIDERFNGGGQVADYFIEVMKRQLEAYWSPRYGNIEHTPNGAIYGPKVMIANEFSGSGGDALPWLFKQAKLGPLVGKRTWGGLVGIGSIPVLMDGGHVTSPSVAFFSPKGEWEVENHGVDPDYLVEQDPKAVSEGHDPQLEKAVALAMDELAKEPVKAVERPSYPNYHQ